MKRIGHSFICAAPSLNISRSFALKEQRHTLKNLAYMLGQACSCPNTICYWLSKQHINDRNSTPISWDNRSDRLIEPIKIQIWKRYWTTRRFGSPVLIFLVWDKDRGFTKRLQIEPTCHKINIRSCYTRSTIVTWLSYYRYAAGKQKRNLLESHVLHSTVKHGTV